MNKRLQNFLLRHDGTVELFVPSVISAVSSHLLALHLLDLALLVLPFSLYYKYDTMTFAIIVSFSLPFSLIRILLSSRFYLSFLLFY